MHKRVDFVNIFFLRVILYNLVVGETGAETYQKRFGVQITKNCFTASWATQKSNVLSS